MNHAKTTGRSRGDGRRMVAALAAAALLAGPWAATDAPARPANAQKVEDVARVLKAKADPRPEDFARVAGDEAERVLLDLLSALKADAGMRLKVARALGFYPGDRCARVLTGVVFHKDEPSDLRAMAMGSLARNRGPAAADDLRPFLSDPDPVLRAGAGRALGVAGDVRGCGLLADALEHEEALEVRGALEEGLKACANRRQP